jgi:cytochrome P450
MMEMIEDRRSAEKKEERSDLFTSLLDAGDEEGEGKLTDNELLGALSGLSLKTSSPYSN